MSRAHASGGVVLFSLVVVLIAVGMALARGGSLDRLTKTTFRVPELLFAGMILQIIFDFWNAPFMTPGWSVVIFAVSQTLVALFLILNWNLPGMGLAAVGLVLNVIVIGLNGAMPVSLDASRIAGIDELGPMGLEHELLTDDTLLPFLGDVIPLPFTQRVISLGDVVLALGIGRFTYRRSIEDPVEAAAPVRESG